MTIGGLFKLSSLIASGVPWKPLLLVLVMTIPQLLFYTIPISILTSTLLVFGRLSSDSEITAMRSCGINLVRIARPIWLFSFLLSLLCFYISDQVIPITHYKTKSTISGLKNVSIDKLIEEGRFVDCTTNLSIFVGQKMSNNFENIRIYDTRDGFRREITAQKGNLKTDPNTGKITLNLLDVRIAPFKKGSPGAAYCDVLPIPFDTQKKQRKYRKKVTNYTGLELIEEIHKLQNSPQEGEPASKNVVKCSLFRVELHKRIVMALSCFIFALVGVPLGVQSHRKETSLNLAMSLGLIVFFHLFMGLAGSMAKHPAIHPYLIAWVPIVVAFIAAIWLIQHKN